MKISRHFRLVPWFNYHRLSKNPLSTLLLFSCHRRDVALRKLYRDLNEALEKVFQTLTPEQKVQLITHFYRAGFHRYQPFSSATKIEKVTISPYSLNAILTTICARFASVLRRRIKGLTDGVPELGEWYVITWIVPQNQKTKQEQ
jgi:hypothetical protein